MTPESPPIVDAEGKINPYGLGIYLGALSEQVRTLGREMAAVKYVQAGILIAVVTDIALKMMKAH